MMPHFLLAIVNALGIFALLTMSYGAILRRYEPGYARSLVLGLMFGGGACLAIADATPFAPGLLLDPRVVMLVLSAPFGGPLAAGIAAAVTAVFRLWNGGVGAPAGVCTIAAAAMIGVGFWRVGGRQTRRASFGHLLCLGLTSSLPMLFILTVPVPNAAAIFLTAIGPLLVANATGVLVLGRVLCNERRNHITLNQLRSEASTDALTGLPNRRHFQRDVDRIIDEARESGLPLSALILDIDLFKGINDRFGHDVGDAVIVRIADTVRAHLRKSDAIARFGGEEIVVAMPDTTGEVAAVIADRIRRVVESTAFFAGAGPVTVSIGVATGQGPAIAYSPLFKAADEALYLAKRRGRNRVEAAGSPETALAA